MFSWIRNRFVELLLAKNGEKRAADVVERRRFSNRRVRISFSQFRRDVRM